MAKSKAQPPITVRDGANDLRIGFEISDDASGNKPQVRVEFKSTVGDVPYITAIYDLSSYSTVTGQEKLDLRAILTKIRNETFTKEGFA